MDKKVSVSQFLHAAARAPGARSRSRPKAKAAPSPPPAPRPRPAPSRPPKDWRALAGGRSGPWWLLPAAILSVLTIFCIVGPMLSVRERVRQPPFVIELTPAERNAQERSKAEHERERRNTDMCENYVTERQRTTKKLIGLHGYDCQIIDQMCPYIMSEGFQVACNDYRYLFELENHGGIWSVKAD